MTDANQDDDPKRARRRERPRRSFDTTIASPCIDVCQLDHDTGYCRGCLRDIDEIRNWMILSADEKRALLDRLEERRKL
jgi:predicted Fe-S protein YdhL (DUF1289 family)